MTIRILRQVRVVSAIVLTATFQAGFPTDATAQAAEGTITGRVTLVSSNDPVHGATVIVIGARRTATTGDDGRFTIANVPAGTYEALAQREHLSAARQTVIVTAGATSTVDFALTIEAAHEEVEAGRVRGHQQRH